MFHYVSIIFKLDFELSDFQFHNYTSPNYCQGTKIEMNNEIM